MRWRGAMPSVAHRQTDGDLADVALADVAVGDRLVVLPHEICPVDGVVVAGHGTMDESYLTGEPYLMSKTPGSAVLSGAINGASALSIEASRLAVDSRYAKIMQVMRTASSGGRKFAVWATGWGRSIRHWPWRSPPGPGPLSGEPLRFLAVLVVATPCPLLIAIPVAIIGSISLAARRGIIIRDPAVLEQVKNCRVVILDKTGTLTYGTPHVVAQHVAAGFERGEVLRDAASVERYSKHPLATAILAAAQREGISLADATSVNEQPGDGLRGTVAGREVRITNRRKLAAADPEATGQFPPPAGGLECCVAIDGRYAATYVFRDEARPEGSSFVGHLPSQHGMRPRAVGFGRSRERGAATWPIRWASTKCLPAKVPSRKLELVRRETAAANTLFLGDGINDAPALTAATVGVAFGQNSDITAEAAGAVIMDASLARVDEFLHIGTRMRRDCPGKCPGGHGPERGGHGPGGRGLPAPCRRRRWHRR